jgi:hypothetical protein
LSQCQIVNFAPSAAFGPAAVAASSGYATRRIVFK